MRVKPLLVALAGLVVLACSARADDYCTDISTETPAVTLTGVDAHGDPLLADGRRLRLVGLAPRQGATEAARFAAALALWRDHDLRLVLLGEPDRWGRLPARLVVAPDTPDAQPLDLAIALVRAGAAWHLPDPASNVCDSALRDVEAAIAASARAGGTAPQAGPVDGHDVAALKVQAGRIVVLEGRVASVGERPQRSYLNFSRRRGAGASIVVSRRLWREMQEAGWTAKALTGKRVRVRGVLGGQDGLALELTARAAMELID